MVNQPADTGVGDLITTEAFDATGGGSGFLQVHVTQTVSVYDPETESYHLEDQALQYAEVTFELPTGSPSSALHVIPRLTNADGNATFAPECDPETFVCDNPLWIGTANQPFTTDYHLIPVATPPPPPEITIASETGTSGNASDLFDVWGDGCKGNGCQVNLTPGNSSSDAYTTSENVGMGASELSLGGTTISCPTQQLIFSSNLFFHATTGNGPVFLVSHISALDRKAAANNGNKVMGWCVGLKNTGPWHFAQQDTNGTSGFQADDLYVGMAPKCPKKNASNSAPCIVSQTGDGVGGTFIRGWLPGGDPPRRT